MLHRALLGAVLLPAVLLLATLGAADVLPEYPSSGVSCQAPLVCHVECVLPSLNVFPPWCRPVLPEVPDGGSGDTASADGLPPYQPAARNLEQRRWLREARLGLFIHWGIYANLGRGEWVLHNDRMLLQDYQHLAPRFNPVSGFGLWLLPTNLPSLCPLLVPLAYGRDLEHASSKSASSVEESRARARSALVCSPLSWCTGSVQCIGLGSDRQGSWHALHHHNHQTCILSSMPLGACDAHVRPEGLLAMQALRQQLPGRWQE